MHNNNTFSKHLRYFRESKNITQKTICNSLSISQSAYSRFENGQRIPTIDIIIKLSEIFDIDIIVLLELLYPSLKTNNTFTNNNPTFSKNYLKLHDYITHFSEPDLDNLLAYADYLSFSKNKNCK